MTLSWRSFAGLWNHVFHSPQSIKTAAFLRIGLAAICLITHAVRGLSLSLFFSESGLMPVAVGRAMAKEYDWSLFFILPPTDTVMWICYWVCLAQMIMLLVGCCTRFSAVCVFIWLVSYHVRNSVVECGGDTVMRHLMFYLMFIPSGARWSVDKWLRCQRGRTEEADERPMWALRMAQIQMCLIYASAAISKFDGHDWVSGNALYYVPRAGRFWQRMPWPDFMFTQSWCYSGLTWSVLFIETMVPILIWFKETRRLAILLAVLLHLGIELSMNIFLFQWTMIVGWLAFVTQEDWQQGKLSLERMRKRRPSLAES